MKRNFLMSLFLVFAITTGFAQEQRKIKEPAKVVFNPHWFMQAQIGAAHTIGEAKFGDLLSPAAALNFGYKFTPVFGLRFGASGLQGKGGWVNPKQDYKFKYLQGNVDAMFDLSNLLNEYKYDRVFNPYLFAGVGVNYGFDNDEANALDTKKYEMEYLWDDSQTLIAGRVGLGTDIRLCEKVALNVEVNANILSDKFNSKKAGNCDWQFNGLVGLSFKLGKSHSKTEPIYYEPEPVPAPVVVKEEPKPQPKQEVVKVQPMIQNVFFLLNSSKIQNTQKEKIDALVAYLTKYPAAKVVITGHADVNTGNKKINLRLSEERANVVAEALKAQGIAAERISIDFKGDTIQPFGTPEENRVSVCVAE